MGSAPYQSSVVLVMRGHLIQQGTAGMDWIRKPEPTPPPTTCISGSYDC